MPSAPGYTRITLVNRGRMGHAGRAFGMLVANFGPPTGTSRPTASLAVRGGRSWTGDRRGVVHTKGGCRDNSGRPAPRTSPGPSGPGPARQYRSTRPGPAPVHSGPGPGPACRRAAGPAATAGSTRVTGPRGPSARWPGRTGPPPTVRGRPPSPAALPRRLARPG